MAHQPDDLLMNDTCTGSSGDSDIASRPRTVEHRSAETVRPTNSGPTEEHDVLGRLTSRS